MKLVLAIIQPPKLDAVEEALNKIEVTRMTVTDVQGYGQQRGRSATYRGHEYHLKLLRKTLANRPDSSLLLEKLEFWLKAKDRGESCGTTNGNVLKGKAKAGSGRASLAG